MNTTVAGGIPKPPAKVSCLACRAAKRKCLTPDAFTVCKRCIDNNLQCEYKKHRRGRRKKDASGVPLDNDHAGRLVGSIGSRPTPRMSSGTGRYDQDSTRHSSHSPYGRDLDHELEPYRHSPAVTTTTATPVTLTEEQAMSTQHGIQFSHVVPIAGEHPAYALPPPNLPTSPPLHATIPQEFCPDPVLSGLITESDAFEMFEFYFGHVNVTVAVLDPVLHTATFCREKSPLLFTAVLTVTAKILKPKAYSSCLLIANKLVGQAVEYGVSTIEVVQALIILQHWKKADDGSSWRKLGYAIRMAQELRLNHRAPRPLPANEKQARQVLNRERCWLNLVVADYHLAMHHSLPRMLNNDDLEDPYEWQVDHPHLPVPGDHLFAPWITFSRMCRLYADMLASMSGSHANLRSLHWLEMEWKRWRKRWLERDCDFLPQQIAMIKMCSALLHFHICEYRLLFCARYQAKNEGDVVDTTQPNSLSYAFAQCSDTALGVLEVFENDFVRNGYLPFCFNLAWVATAIASVWLVKNIQSMDQVDRVRIIRVLKQAEDSTLTASLSSDDMAAYTHRLLKHLLGTIKPEWHLQASQPGSALNISPPGVNLQLASSPGHMWTMPSTTQMIQDNLWNPSNPSTNPFEDYQTQLQQTSSNDSLAQASIHAGGHNGTGEMTHFPTDMLFPAADDDIWKLLFPL